MKTKAKETKFYAFTPVRDPVLPFIGEFSVNRKNALILLGKSLRGFGMGLPKRLMMKGDYVLEEFDSLNDWRKSENYKIEL